MQENSEKWNLELLKMLLTKNHIDSIINDCPCTIGIMDMTFVDELRCTVLLTKKEISICESFQNQERRMQWMVGRILSKYLILNHLFGDKISNSKLIKVDDSTISTFSSWMYKNLQIIPSEKRRGFSIMSWCGKKLKMDISISYKERKAYSVVINGKKAGLDVERVERRSSSFYDGNFTYDEIKWAQNLDEKEGLSSDWIYTLHWVIKEAAIKSWNSNEVSIWDFKSIDISIHSNIECIKEIYNSMNLCEIKSLEVTLNNHGYQQNTYVKVGNNQNKILALVYN